MIAPDMPPWSRASAPIWTLVSGYSSSVRRNKTILFLQAFTDDSGSEHGDRRLYMAGYVNTAENWAVFSDDWDKALKDSPAIKYMKMSEANNLSGQFRGWSEKDRDEKIAKLRFIISASKPDSFDISVDRSYNEAVITPVAPRGIGSPHFYLAFGVISMVSRFCLSKGSQLPIKFVFDTQTGLDQDIALFFTFMKRSIPRRARKLISGNPVFENDLMFLPIQAADMLAWSLRREHEKGSPLSLSGSLRGENHVSSTIPNKGLDKFATAFSKIPSDKELQKKPTWRKMREEIKNQIKRGYIPPHGTRTKNILFYARDFLKRTFSPWL